MKPSFSIRFSGSFGEFLLFIVLQLFFMRKSGLSSGFLKLGCYCSRILIHITLFSNTRLQQQAMAGITQCSKILIRILSFSNTRLQQQAMVWITQRSKILIRILPFCNTRLASAADCGLDYSWQFIRPILLP